MTTPRTGRGWSNAGFEPNMGIRDEPINLDTEKGVTRWQRNSVCEARVIRASLAPFPSIDGQDTDGTG